MIIMKGKLVLLAITVLLVSLLSPAAYALEFPNFPSCVNPSGSLKIKYDNGQHAIVGRSSLYSGKDEVYWLGDGNALQCFCPSEGTGVQTNWMKALNVSDSDRAILASNGWHYIAKGLDWGLDAAPYFAKNFDYQCNSSSSGSDNSSGIGGGGTSAVLGLAQTGNNATYIAFFSLGISLVTGGLFLRRKKHASNRF